MLPDFLLDRAPRFELQCGGLTSIGKHTTGWRTLPALLIAHILPGNATLEIAGVGQFPVRQGECMLVPPGVRHKIDQFRERAISRWVHVNYYAHDHFDLFCNLTLPPVLTPRQATALGSTIVAWYESGAPTARVGMLLHRAREAEFGMRLLALLAPLLYEKEECAGRNNAALEAVRPALEMMEREFARTLRRKELAGAANLSAAQFHRVFRKAIGATPADYLCEIRMRRAQRALLTGTLPVKAIAGEVGYADVFVFSKAFKRRYGISPQTYRRSSADHSF